MANKPNSIAATPRWSLENALIPKAKSNATFPGNERFNWVV
jgi:hypothetical protein